MTGTKESCTCDKCVKACTHKPGWFMPGEAEKAAELLGVSLEELFRTRLVVDCWHGEDPEGSDNRWLLAPHYGDDEPGKEQTTAFVGRCTFLTDDGRCEIHEAKPFECRESLHDDEEGIWGPRHEAISKAWEGEPQAQIVKLLGRKPNPPDAFDVLFSFLDYVGRMR